MALLEHNQKVYNEAVTYFNNGGKDLLIVQDTGTGKSYICAELLNTIFKGKSVLYVVPMHKVAENFKSVLGYYDNIDFVSYKSFKGMDSNLDNVDVIIFDEAHHIGSEVSGKIIQNIIKTNKSKYIIGFTATPIREDRIDISKFFSKVINGVSVFDCIESGLMPKFTYISCSDSVIRDINNYRREYNTNSIVKNGIAYNLKIDWNNSKELVSDIVRNSHIDKWICFFRTIKELNENEEVMKDIFKGYSIVKINSYSEEVDLDRLKECTKVVILSVNMFLEGIHLKGIQGILISRNVGSVLVFRQMLGRVSSIGSTISPIVIDCTNTLSRILVKIIRLNEENKGKSELSERTEYKFRNILDTTLIDKKYIDISNMLQDLWGIGKLKTIKGYTFGRDSELSLQLGKDNYYVARYKKLGLSYEEIIDKATKIDEGIKVGNYVFYSDVDLCKQLGTGLDFVRRLKRRGFSYEEIIKKAEGYNILGYKFKTDTELDILLKKSKGYVTRLKNKGLSYERIITDTLNESKTVLGYTFKSDSDLSRQLGKYNGFAASKRRQGFSYEEIIKNALEPEECKTVLGYTFKNSKDLSIQLGRSMSYVTRNLKKGLSYEEIILISTEKKRNEIKLKSCMGYVFSNDTDLSRKLGMSKCYVRILRKQGLSYEDIIKKASSWNTTKSICGYTFKTDTELSKLLNKPDHYVSRNKSKGLSYEQIIDRAKKECKKEKTILGYTFKSDADLSRQLGKRVAYVNQYRGKGLSYEEIIKMTITKE